MGLRLQLYTVVYEAAVGTRSQCGDRIYQYSGLFPILDWFDDTFGLTTAGARTTVWYSTVLHNRKVNDGGHSPWNEIFWKLRSSWTGRRDQKTAAPEPNGRFSSGSSCQCKLFTAYCYVQMARYKGTVLHLKRRTRSTVCGWYGPTGRINQDTCQSPHFHDTC